LEALLLDVRISSLACVGNVIQNLPVSILKDLQRVWNGLIRQTSLLIPAHNQTKLQSSVIQELGSLTYVLWQISNKFKQLVVNESELSLALGLTRYGKSSEIRLHAVNLLQNLGQFPCFITDKHNLEIGKALLDVIGNGVKEIQPITLEVLVEAVMGLISVYSEDDIHVNVIKEIKLLNCCKDTLKKLLQKAEQLQKNVDDDDLLYGRLLECIENLERFIPYKEKNG